MVRVFYKRTSNKLFIAHVLLSLLLLLLASNCGAATQSIPTNNTNTNNSLAQGVDAIIKRSSKCSKRGTFFSGVRTRYVCTNNEIVSEAIYNTRNTAQRVAAAVNLALNFFNNQTVENRSNTSSLTNFTYLNEFGTSLLNDSSIDLPCTSVKYNESFCACPHDYSGLKCETLKRTVCNVSWIRPDIRECLASNGQSLPDEVLKQFRYNIHLHGIPPCYRLSNIDSPDVKNVTWSVSVNCGFENSNSYTPRKCNGTTATSSIDDQYCLEDTTLKYWYVNNEIGKSVWASTRRFNVYGRVQFYGMNDFALNKVAFYTESKLNGSVLNGPSILNISINPNEIYNTLVTDRKWGRYYGEFKLDYDRFVETPDALESNTNWGENERSFILLDIAEYIDETLHTKVILLWWHWLLIIISIVVFLVFLACFLYILWDRKFKDKED